MPVEQTVVNTLFGLVSALLGWGLKVIWDSLRQLQETDKELADKVSQIEVLVAGRYVTREEFTSVVNRLFQRLDLVLEAL
ncbi:MAG: Burkholderia phage vB BceS, partial [Planctomycetota bacterium]